MQVVQRHIALLVHLHSTGAVAELVTFVLEDMQKPLFCGDKATTDDLLAELKGDRKEDLKQAQTEHATTLCPCDKLIGLLQTVPADVSCLADCIHGHLQHQCTSVS